MNDFFAALPMYDWPEVRAEADAEWAAIRARLAAAGFDAPERLVRRNADMPAVPGGIRNGAGKVIAPDPATLSPDGLDFPTVWRHPKLLFGQACWGPLEDGLACDVRVVGQPDYSAYEGGEGEFYSSAVVMRRDSGERRRSFAPPSVLPDIAPSRGEIGRLGEIASLATPAIGEIRTAGAISPLVGGPKDGRDPWLAPESGWTEGGNVGCDGAVASPPSGRPRIPLDLIRGRRLAFNSDDSMSGIIALTRDLTAMGESLEIFSERIETGGHRNSIVAVAEGRADVAAIDCRSWALAQRFEPAAREVAAVGWTARRKGLPYIAAFGSPVTRWPP
ncbi:PhnD/SsuA/transferrin family substrate-binding protein [Mesorhizobium sp. LHD-90]|uniref:PhnD/SsuA/transferrin family substrate-binding protein n=1 Tax=Mesorhizobium sp. LHD-90 TaxID=3071414 RepID=UPI0027DF081C|nr:PhnD/SsuA/transferrin family substrate-binding protein [Mesorhizobium sp. LHD-90]MDQ6433041.1 PhnD/SsuA/transferrin family substrate-binding protein [Mesorhizobium sp. LHD-90]